MYACQQWYSDLLNILDAYALVTKSLDFRALHGLKKPFR